MFKRIKKITILLTIALFLCLCACDSQSSILITQNNGLYSTSFIAMDTVMTISVYDKKASKHLKAAYDEILLMEKSFSAYDKDSEVSKINQHTNQGILVSQGILDQLLVVQKVSNMTQGALDITVLPLMKAWGFPDGNYTVPSDVEISRILKNVGYEKIRIQEDMVYKDEDVKIDLGSVTKGYAGQITAELLKRNGAKAGILSLGGNMQMFGYKPDGSLWNIAIQDPKDQEGIIGVISATDCAIITSGSYQRHFIQDGVLYHHILNPHTGYPAKSGLSSVTVVAPNGTYADALSTALFVMGSQKGIEVWKAYHDFEAVFVTEDNTVYITEGLEDSFSSQNPNYLYEYIYK